MKGRLRRVGGPGRGDLAIDSATGAGAYTIEGGSNGGVLDFLGAFGQFLAYIWIPKRQWFAHLLKISPTVIDNIGFFGNLYGATLDMIGIGAKCGDNALPAALAYFAFASIFWWLARTVIGTVTFGLGLLLGLMLNAIIEFLIKPAILSECIKS